MSSCLEEYVLFILEKSLSRFEKEDSIKVQWKWEKVRRKTMAFYGKAEPDIAEAVVNVGYKECPEWIDIREERSPSSGAAIARIMVHYG